MDVLLGTVFSVSVSIVASCNRRGIVGSGVFCWVPPEATTSRDQWSKPVSRESESAVSSKETDTLEVVADGCPRWRRGRQRNPHCKLLHSNAEFVVRQLLTSKDVNMDAEEATVLEAFTRQPVKTQQSKET
jgi:hypothetical protein